MDDMGGVADKRKPWANEAAGDLEAERKGLDPRSEADPAQFRREAIFELAGQILGVESEQRAGVGAPLVPDDARPAARKRQDRERPGGQEMLLRAAFVVALVLDRRDDAGLVIVPADGCNISERPQLRARAIGGDAEASPQDAAVGQPDLGDALALDPTRNRGREAMDLEFIAARRERAD